VVVAGAVVVVGSAVVDVVGDVVVVVVVVVDVSATAVMVVVVVGMQSSAVGTRLTAPNRASGSATNMVVC
jgi:hypothetical protein